MLSNVLTVLLSFVLMVNLMMRIYNGNGKKKQFVHLYQNLGMCNIASKFHEIEWLIFKYSPHCLSISEVKMDDHHRLLIENMGYSIEESGERHFMLIAKSIIYERMPGYECQQVPSLFICRIGPN